MISAANVSADEINIDDEWNFGDDEFLMHTLHAYPAKFPAFIASKAFDYAEKEGVNVKSVSDIFCGCGTVALEAMIQGKDFWGCDINPVATLIARAKSTIYDVKKVEEYYKQICDRVKNTSEPDLLYDNANERLKYWFTKKNYMDLYKIKDSIDICIPNGKYKIAFLCLFSAILKAASKWLTKSVKPQVDPKKKEMDVQ